MCSDIYEWTSVYGFHHWGIIYVMFLFFQCFEKRSMRYYPFHKWFEIIDFLHRKQILFFVYSSLIAICHLSYPIRGIKCGKKVQVNRYKEDYLSLDIKHIQGPLILLSCYIFYIPCFSQIPENFFPICNCQIFEGSGWIFYWISLILFRGGHAVPRMRDFLPEWRNI